MNRLIAEFTRQKLIIAAFAVCLGVAGNDLRYSINPAAAHAAEVSHVNYAGKIGGDIPDSAVYLRYIGHGSPLDT